MPYIDKERRAALLNSGAKPENAGELNFLITTRLTDMVVSYGASYTTFNQLMGRLERSRLELTTGLGQWADSLGMGPIQGFTQIQILGVLSCVQQEFYRRVVAPYEDQKCRENGDVFK